MMEQEKNFCQSCGMPLKDAAILGTEANGGTNADYCVYCYKDGAFTLDVSMEEMIEQCVPHMVSEEMSEAKARGLMSEYFPLLKRWAKH